MLVKVLQLFLIIALNLILASSVMAYYSPKYDEHLEKMVLTDPKKSLEQASKDLISAELSGNIEKQLISLYYKAQAYDILSQFDALEKTIEKGYQLAENHNDIRFLSEFMGFKAYLHDMRTEYREALANASRAHRYASETDDKRLISQSLSMRGQVHLSLENYGLAMKDVESAIETFKQNDDKQNLSTNFNLLAIIYSALGDDDSALKFYQESLKFDELKSSYDLSSVYYNIGATYAAKKNYDKAVDYYEKSIEQSLEVNDLYSLAFTNYGIAEILILQDKPLEARKKLSSVFELFSSNQDLLMLFNSHLLMAEIQTINKEYQLAKEHLDLAEKQSKEIDTPSVYIYFYHQKIIYLVAQEMWEEAYDLKKKSAAVRSKVYEKDKEKLISEMQVKFNAKFDQEKLNHLTTQNVLQKKAITYEKTRQKYLLALAILGGVLFFITLYAYRSQKKSKKYLYNLSVTDYLTQVANRRHIMDIFKKIFSNKSNTNFGIIMIDLDYFKKINDTYGHDVGNAVLIHFAQTAKNIMSDVGEVGRIGGEEWLILLPNIDRHTIKAKLSELRKAYQNVQSEKIPKDCNLSFSSGALINSGKYQSHEEMLHIADGAMYEAKKNGREQDVFVSN